MQTQLAFVVIFATVICDGRQTSQFQASKLPTGVHAMSAPATTAAKGPSTSTFNICFPYPCPNTAIITSNPRFELKGFPPAKWLKIRKMPFNPLLINYTSELNNYAQSTGYPVAVPVVVKVDVPIGHKQRYGRYIQRWNEIMSQIEHMNNNTSSLTSHLLSQQTYSARINALTNQLQAEFSAYISDFHMTVLNYVHPQYQLNPLAPGAVVEEPPVPTNANLTIVNEPGFTVFSSSFVAVNGITDSHAKALELSSMVNVPFSTYYLANYLNMNFEIWVTPNPAKTIFR